jgi:hypothetical protein
MAINQPNEMLHRIFFKGYWKKKGQHDPPPAPHYISREPVWGSIHENEEKDIRKGHTAGNHYLKYMLVYPFILLIAHQLVQSPKDDVS